jgi:hypothetical protein
VVVVPGGNRRLGGRGSARASDLAPPRLDHGHGGGVVRLAKQLTSAAALTVAALLALAAAGCSSSEPSPGSTASPGTASGQPKTEAAATAVVQEWLHRFTSGDFAGAWQLYTDEGKAAVSQADYITLNATCPSVQGTQITNVSVRVNGDTAAGHAQVGNVVGTYALAYQHGEWLIEPTSSDLAEYKTGIDATIAFRKAEGEC